jgi:NAD(P)H dehydrogenase (quinone)
MNVLVVYSHPNPKSFNHAILEALREGLAAGGHAVKVRDLYAEPFKATLDAADFGQIMGGSTPADIKAEQDLVTWAEGLIFIYPVWWFGLPAALKGWIDRVFLQNFAFAVTPEGLKGLLKHKRALVLNTTGGPEGNYDAANSKEMTIRPMTDGTLRFCGIPDVQHKTFFAVPYIPQQAREVMLQEVKELGARF